MNRKTPPCFSTGDPGSFAKNTMKKRKILIIEQVAGADQCPQDRRDALLALKEEILGGTVFDPFDVNLRNCGLLEDKETETWKKTIACYIGRSWFDIPFYFAEAYLYLRILIAFGYFEQGSSTFGKDPFEKFKKHELLSRGGGLDTAKMVEGTLTALDESEDKWRTLILNCLWGNRIDLSMFHLADRSREKLFTDQEQNLLIDHSERLRELLERAARIDVILDNVGSELVCDLLLAWHLLSSSKASEVHLHAKKHPIYVSDAMQKDVQTTVREIADADDEALSRIGKELMELQEKGRFVVHLHYFWNSALHYDELPGEIHEELLESNLVILKGDVNYRRLLQDRRWDSWERLEDLTPYFPSSFATLRTMKSEIAVDIQRERAQRLSQIDPEWRVNGERGIIQVVERNLKKFIIRD